MKFVVKKVRVCGFCSLIDVGEKAKARGVLTVCPTPIGNLQDWSLRQDKALFGADVIACEDTRSIGMLIQMLNKKSIRQSVFEMYGEHPRDVVVSKDEEEDAEVQDFIFAHRTKLEK